MEAEPKLMYKGLDRVEYMIGPVRYVVDLRKPAYLVEEPSLSEDEAVLVNASVEFVRRGKASSAREAVVKVAEELGIGKYKSENVMYHVSKRLSPWGPLYPIVADEFVEEVSAVAGRRVSIVHRMVASHEYIDTNVIAPDADRFTELLYRIASAAGTAITPAFPIAEAELEGNRVTMVLGVVANSPTISIRKQPRIMPSLSDLVEDSVISREAAEYLVSVLRNRGMVFIVGPQGSGKTTLLNALLEQLPTDWKIVVVEDVPELRPRHPRFLSLRIRRARSLSENRATEIGYRELLRTALRLRGQFTGITEARGEEVLYLFEAAALGEASAATFHARDWRELRLRLARLGVRDDMMGLLWSVVVMARVFIPGRGYARRVKSIYEVTPEGLERLLYRYDSSRDRLVKVADPVRLSSVISVKGEETLVGAEQ